MATLTVKRDSGWADAFRKYHVLIDGVSIGKIGPGETIQTEIDHYSHSIQAKIDWCGSQSLSIDGAKDQTVIVRSALRGWRILLIYYYILFDWQGYLELETND